MVSATMPRMEEPREVVRVDTQPRREREQLCLPMRMLPSRPRAGSVCANASTLAVHSLMSPTKAASVSSCPTMRRDDPVERGPGDAVDLA